MNAQEAILKIKALFEDNAAPVQELEAAPTETKVELAEYSLADGSKVEISALEVGGTVKLADGTSPAMGEYQLMDGTSIQLDENGIIVEIAAPAEDTMPEEAAPADMNKAQDQKMAEQFADFEIKIAELEEAKKKSEEKVNELESKVKQGFAQVAELIEALSNQPTADPIQKPNSFSEFVSTKNIKEERLNKYRNAILNNKN
jgi:hypothetical protein